MNRRLKIVRMTAAPQGEYDVVLHRTNARDQAQFLPNSPQLSSTTAGLVFAGRGASIGRIPPRTSALNSS
jgi:hypothetical protein